MLEQGRYTVDSEPCASLEEKDADATLYALSFFHSIPLLMLNLHLSLVRHFFADVEGTWQEDTMLDISKVASKV